MYRSRRELSNGALIVKFDIDTAENEPSKVWPVCLPLSRTNSYVHDVLLGRAADVSHEKLRRAEQGLRSAGLTARSVVRPVEIRHLGNP